MNKRLKFLGLDVFFSIALVIIAVLCSLIQCIGLKPTAESLLLDPIFIDMKYNGFAYAVGILIYAGCLVYYFRWFLKLKYSDYPLRRANVVIMHFMISFVFCFAMVIALVFASLLLIGLNKNLVPEFLTFITVFVWPIATFLLMNAGLVHFLVRTRKEKEEPEEDDAPSKTKKPDNKKNNNGKNNNKNNNKNGKTKKK